jgi:lipopolysaccharide heptosyltransferase II
MNPFASAALTIAGVPFRLFSRRPFEPPVRLLILKPCCLSQVLMATPLLVALDEAFPKARIDWGVSEWARPAVASNPRLTDLVDTGRVGLPGGHRADAQALIERLRRREYDTCFVPARSAALSYVAWQAGIPQRIGLNVSGRGFAYTQAVRPPQGVYHEVELYLSLARAIGLEPQADMEFHPSDAERTAVMACLLDEIGWQEEQPLVLVHPAGASNPISPDENKRWPMERFAVFASRMIRERGAQVILLGSEQDRPLVQEIFGVMAATVPNLAGRLSLGELGALCEIADLYVGNDAGPTQVAAAVGCPTLAIFGPSDPAISAPLPTSGEVVVLRSEKISEPFSWANGLTVDDAVAAAGRLLDRAVRGEQQGAGGKE